MFLLVPAYPGSRGQKAVKRLCVCVCVCVNRWRQRGSEKSPAATTWFTASSMKAAAFKEDSVRASFLPRDAPLAQECGTALSPSVTSRYCAKTAGRIELVFLSRKPRLTLHRILERNLCRNKGLLPSVTLSQTRSGLKREKDLLLNIDRCKSQVFSSPSKCRQPVCTTQYGRVARVHLHAAAESCFQARKPAANTLDRAQRAPLYPLTLKYLVSLKITGDP